MNIIKTVTGATFALGFAVGMAAADTINFETDEAGFVSVASVGGTQTFGNPLGPFSGAGTTFTIDADTFDVVGAGTIALNGEQNIEITQNIEGLGIDNNNGIFGSDSSQIDGSGSNDILVFTFARVMRLSRIIFENVSDNDDFVFYVPGADPNATEYDIVNPLPFPDINGDEGFFDFGNIEVTSFGIGALGRNDNFRLSRIEIAPVPLPASALLLLAAVGGLGVMRMRKRAA